MIERVPYYGWPKPTPDNAERIEAWRRKYALVPIEAQLNGSGVDAVCADTRGNVPCVTPPSGTPSAPHGRMDQCRAAPAHLDPPAGDDLHHPSGRPLTYDELSGGF